MPWPPNKAWTSKFQIHGLNHFVAINYGVELGERWILLSSVLDGSVSIKVSWCELQDSSIWIEGWEENDFLDPPLGISQKCYKYFSHCNHPSQDSGLTIPISKKNIRPWFEKSLK